MMAQRWQPKPRLDKWSWLPSVILVVITFIIYFPSLRGGFVFDDDSLIVHNQLVRSSDGLYRFWLTREAPDYWPLTSTIWWLEWRAWRANPLGYHVVNVFLHALNALLLWTILRRLKIPGSWFAAAIFAVHPVNVATVAWISEQKNTLSLLFYTLAILLFLEFDETARRCSFVLSLATFCLALLSKTAVVMLPVVLLLCLWWQHRRIRWKDILRTAPFFPLSLASGLTTMWFQSNRAMGTHAAQTTGFATRLAVAGCAPWFYLYKALLPLNLTVIYPKWVIDPHSWISYAPGFILVGSLIVLWRKRETWGRPLFFGLGYFLVTLFPVLGFFDQTFHRYSWVADHWAYLSIIGIIALVVAGGERICRPIGNQTIGAGVGLVVVLLLGTGRLGTLWCLCQ